ncbi:MAG: hypothetical protein K2H13_00285 [Eubacterium sp.]|nr:hypothetical protein [Eubacterium sp.]MDE6156253.1 hypothetical protein [Eubacterium sp.]
MEYRLGNSTRIKASGDTLELTCPNCGKKVQFGVFSNFERRLAPKITLLDCNNVYFLVCPSCAAVYTVDEARGNSFKKGEKLSIGNFDLKTLKEFKTKL